MREGALQAKSRERGSRTAGSRGASAGGAPAHDARSHAARSPRDERAVARRDLVIALALVASAAGVRAYAISRGHQLDIDEADTALKVAKPLGDLIADLRRDGHPPLYFLLLKGWTALFGRGEIALRSLSLIFSCATLVLLLATGRRLFGRTVALFAGLFFVLSPVEIFHASEGRMYALVPLLALGAMALACEVAARADTISWRHALLLLATLIAALYTHNYGLFLPAAVALLALWVFVQAPKAAGAHRRVAAVLLGIAIVAYVCYLPWLPILQAQRESKAHVWLVEFFEATPPILAVPLSLAALSGAGPYPPITPPLENQDPLLPVMLPLAIVLFAAGAQRALRGTADVEADVAANASRAPRESIVAGHNGPLSISRVARAAPLIFLIVVLGAPWIVSVTAKVIYLVGRYDVVALPFVILLLGAGAAALIRWRRALALVPLAFLLSPLPAVGALFALRAGGDVVEQVSWVASHPETRAVVATQLAGSRFRYYLAKMGRRDALVRSFPTSTDEHTGWYERPRADDPGLAADADSLIAGFQARLAPGELLWATLYDNDVAKPVLVQTLARYFAPVPDATRFDLGLIAVTREPVAYAEPEPRGEPATE